MNSSPTSTVKLKVRKFDPITLHFSPNEKVDVLVDNSYVRKLAKDITVGDIIAFHGIVTQLAN